MIVAGEEVRRLDWLARRGKGSDPALTAGGRTLTYAELDDEVGALGAVLQDFGLGPGDRVASWMGKTVTACLLPLAAARAGLVHVPVNPLLKRGQAAHILADSGAGLLIANSARLGTLGADDRGQCRSIALEDLKLGSERLQPGTGDPCDLAALLYTSGSSGRPKGVMLSHANLWLGAASVARFLALQAGDRTLAVLPLAFDYGQNQLLSTWYAGAAAIAFDYLLARDLVAAVRRHDVTVLAGVPPLWIQLAEMDWSGDAGKSLRVLTNSGGHLPLPTVRRLRALFPDARLHLMYGLTEAFRSTSLDPALVDSHPDSVGTAIPFAEVMVVGPDGRQSGPGEEGEIVHAGPLVAMGYWRDPERTARRFRPAPEGSRLGGTAVWSGDRGVRGEDDLIRIRGRADGMLKVAGNRLSPQEIEEAALASGAVRQALAIGLPDDRIGQSILLVAVPSGEQAEDRLLSYLRSELPAFMQPKRIEWRDDLPLSPNGKVDRVLLEREYS